MKARTSKCSIEDSSNTDRPRGRTACVGPGPRTDVTDDAIITRRRWPTRCTEVAFLKNRGLPIR